MEQPKPRVGIGVFIFKDGKFLIGQRKGSHGAETWSVPGGHLDFRETIEEGAARETCEETGLTIAEITIAGITNDIFRKEQKHYVTIWVTSQWQRGEVEVREPEEYVSMNWITFKELPDNLFLPWKQLLLADFYPAIQQQARSPKN